MMRIFSLLALLAPRSNELIPEGSIPDGLVKYDEGELKSLTKSGNYIGRLQLMTSNSEKCKSGEFPANHYAHVEGDSYQDLGKEVDILVVCARPTAIDASGDEFIVSHDQESELFKTIQDRSLNVQDSGCMFGPEFLVYIPKIDVFATFLMGTKTARREAPKVLAKQRKAATMKSKKCSSSKYTWFGPLCEDCVSPFDTPAIDRIVKEADKFNNPPAPSVELAEEAESTNERER